MSFFTLKWCIAVFLWFCENCVTRKNLFHQLWSKMLSTNQIVGFFDHQYLWIESIGTFDFLHGVNHQGKARSETTTIVWLWLVALLIQSDCMIFLSSIYLEESTDTFFCTVITAKERQDLRLLLLVGCNQLCLVPSYCRIFWSLILWKESNDFSIIKRR